MAVKKVDVTKYMNMGSGRKNHKWATMMCVIVERLVGIEVDHRKIRLSLVERDGELCDTAIHVKDKELYHILLNNRELMVAINQAVRRTWPKIAVAPSYATEFVTGRRGNTKAISGKGMHVYLQGYKYTEVE